MRAHRDFEWPDTYNPENLEDLKRFYDRYLKGIHNGWEMTPRVRLDVMDAYDCDYQTQRAETAFPIPERTHYEKLYFDAADITLKTAAPAEAASASYDPADGQLEFDYTVPEDMEVTGYMNLRLYVSCEGHNEMDLFVNIQKAAADGTWIPWYTLDEPHPGAWGKCRVSRRELDEKLSKKHIPILSNTHEDKLEDGKVYPVDIAIVPTSRVYHKGERFRVQIAGRYIREGWFEPLAWDTDNGGTHTVHTGGDTASYIEIPVVEPRYVAGDYVRRWFACRRRRASSRADGFSKGETRMEDTYTILTLARVDVDQGGRVQEYPTGVQVERAPRSGGARPVRPGERAARLPHCGHQEGARCEQHRSC